MYFRLVAIRRGSRVLVMVNCGKKINVGCGSPDYAIRIRHCNVSICSEYVICTVLDGELRPLAHLSEVGTRLGQDKMTICVRCGKRQVADPVRSGPSDREAGH
jgi:hypothetical protein